MRRHNSDPATRTRERDLVAPWQNIQPETIHINFACLRHMRQYLHTQWQVLLVLILFYSVNPNDTIKQQHTAVRETVMTHQSRAVATFRVRSADLLTTCNDSEGHRELAIPPCESTAGCLSWLDQCEETIHEVTDLLMRFLFFSIYGSYYLLILLSTSINITLCYCRQAGNMNG